MDRINKFAPAYGPGLVAGAEETTVYQNFMENKSNLYNVFKSEHVFGSFHPFLIGAKKTNGNEWQPHDEIWEVFESQLKGMHAHGGYDKYLSHGYGVGKINAKELMPEEYDIVGRLHATIASRIADIVGKDKLVIGLGTSDDGYGRNEDIIIRFNGKAMTLHDYLKDKEVAFFRQHWEERLQYLSDLPVDLYCIETAHNQQEVLSVARLVQEQQGQLLPMLYATKEGTVPDVRGNVSITDMIAFFEENCKDIMIGYGANCITREVATAMLEELEGYPTLLRRFIALWTNSSPNCYEHDYDSRYKEPLAEFIYELLKKYPHLQYVTGCCGHKDEEVKEIKTI